MKKETGDADMWIFYIWEITEVASVNGVIPGSWGKREEWSEPRPSRVPIFKDEPPR